MGSFLTNFLFFSFSIAGLFYFLGICETYNIQMLTIPYNFQRFDNFKALDHLKLLKSENISFTFPKESTVDMVGCCLERQTLVSYLFEQKEMTDQFQYSEIHDTFVTNKCDVYFNNSLFQFCRVYYTSLIEFPYVAGNITYLNNVIHVYMQWPFHVGDFVFITLTAICMFPQEILDKSSIILYETNPIVLDALASFNINEDRIIVTTHAEEIFYVHHLYSITPHHCNSLRPVSFQKLRDHFIKYYNLDKNPPKNFVLLSRTGKTNELMNSKDILQTFNEAHPEINWLIDNEPKEFKNLVPYYNNILCLFTCTSSSIALSMFMQKDSVVCEIHGQFFEPLYLHSSAYLGHHHILARIPGMSKTAEDPYELPLDTAAKMLELALNYINGNQSKTN
ncbi:hypothetical protein TRFO_10859 [Tritrichomonas foetus]|uniref:Glycosyltransferase 61 catalytic domain-containing protein n=1 Tax=Tritrichomonas foetus TaxID=1144522 RepID=A0A1J4JBX0_9EUKA|nr:hypothetical protein TRFO_10859 [Tritrichomonas foetus]|eukprot:OHS94909.1 hypothetical protein TRFO_10859 [Tritrichomonas foetus]